MPPLIPKLPTHMYTDARACTHTRTHRIGDLSFRHQRWPQNSSACACCSPSNSTAKTNTAQTSLTTVNINGFLRALTSSSPHTVLTPGCLVSTSFVKKKKSLKATAKSWAFSQFGSYVSCLQHVTSSLWSKCSLLL